MKRITLFLISITINFAASAQDETLQTVTDRGNTTTHSVQIGGNSVNANTTKLFINNPAGKNFALSSGANYFTESGFHIYNWSDNSSAPHFSITNDGKVGIGTPYPASKLHISSELNGISALNIGNPNSPGNLNVPIGGSPGGYNIDFYTWRDMLTDQIGARIRAERMNFFEANSAYVQAMDLSFYTSSGWNLTDLTEKMRVCSTGNVGIGTSTPTEKLAVNGKIKAKEIRVDNSGWSDFVFAKDYRLPSLKEVETHIKEKGHLQNIPSAAEVKVNGIELGDMNAKLLQKIEELTLYLIEKDKERQAMDIKIKDLEDRLKRVEIKN